MVFQRRDTAVLTADKMVHKDANAWLKREKSICSRNWHVLVQSSAVETGICFCLAGITLFWVSLGLLGISFWSVLMQFEWQVVCMYMSACVRFMIWVIKMLCIIIFGRALIFEIERQLLFLTRMNIVFFTLECAVTTAAVYYGFGLTSWSKWQLCKYLCTYHGWDFSGSRYFTKR